MFFEIWKINEKDVLSNSGRRSAWWRQKSSFEAIAQGVVHSAVQEA